MFNWGSIKQLYTINVLLVDSLLNNLSLENVGLTEMMS